MFPFTSTMNGFAYAIAEAHQVAMFKVSDYLLLLEVWMLPLSYRTWQFCWDYWWTETEESDIIM